MLAAFFLFARALRVAFVALQALAGIMVLGAGMHKWAKNRR